MNVAPPNPRAKAVPQPAPRHQGAAIAHDSAALHVEGKAVYVDDIREPDGTLHVVPGYAKASLGAIVSMDLDEVRQAPGVVAVLTHRDIPGTNDCSPSFNDDRVLAEGRVEYHGQPVFAVVARSREEGRRAARLAMIAVAEEPPNVTVEQAEAAGQDVLPPYAFGRGDVEEAILAAPLRLEGTMRIGGQEHFYLEGQVALAVPQEDGGMLVHSSTQHPTEVQHTVAKVLAVPDALVVCECRRMGGGFGGKESQAAQWAALAALAARITGRPAKCRLDRDDDMRMTGKRHDFRVDWRVGCDKAGKVSGVAASFAGRCGVSADLSLGVNDRTMFHADNAYFYPAVDIRSRRLKTDTVSNTAFRGFGGPQGMLFAERMMDEIAIVTGLDPLDIRKRNLYRPGRDVTPYGMPLNEHIALPLIETLEKSSDYRARRKQIAAYNAEHAILKKGIALTPVKFGISFTLTHLNQAGALVHVYTDGSVQLNHGGTEMGQGLNVKVAQVVADEFGIDLSRVRITATTTQKVPNTAPTAASAGTDLNAMAAQRAAETIRKRMIEAVAQAHAVDPHLVRFAENHVSAGNQRWTFADVAKLCFLNRVQLSATGYYATPKIHWDREKAKGRPFLYFAYGAACSEVTIDTLTGEMRVDRVDILHDCGTSLNPAIDIGQIEGGFVQGMGWLTTEELVFDDKGRLLTHAPSTYKIPTARDVPADFRVSLFDSRGNKEPVIFRSKAVGEPPLMLAISVFSAITHALAALSPGRVPPLDAPATPEAILRAADAMRA